MSKVICILLAAATPILAAAQPAQLQSSQAGAVYLGDQNADDWGRPLTNGDFDGDGYDEIVIGASESWGDVLSKVYILRGGPGAHALGQINLTTTAADQTILGAALNDNLGCSLAAGDFNGDGIDDLLMCASSADYPGMTSCGIAYLIYGGAGFFDNATRDLSVESNWDLRFIGPVAYGDMGGKNAFGGLDAQAAAVGNVNGDAYGDVVLGVHLANGGATQSGRVYVVHGDEYPSGSTLPLLSFYNTRINGIGQYDELGSVVLTGDLTGDGIDEVILPNEYDSQGLFTSEGAVHILRGRAAWPSNISLGSTPAEITLLGAREDDNLGVSAAVGDFNNDGIIDLASAAPGADAGAFNDQRGDGFVYGLLGSTAYQTGAYVIDYAAATPDFLLIGEFEENLGMLVTAGDYNADGFDDIAAGEWFAGPSTNGAVEVLFGREFAPGAVFTADVDTDMHILGEANDRISFSLATSDVNGDGLDEILFGSPFANNYYGKAFVFTYASGDPDADHDLDMADFAAFQQCQASPTVGGACALFDFNLDETLDVDDLNEFEAQMTGPEL